MIQTPLRILCRSLAYLFVDAQLRYMVIIISRRLGHFWPTITLDIYGHLISGMQEEAAQLIDELITPVEFQQLHTTAPDLHPISTVDDTIPHI